LARNLACRASETLSAAVVEQAARDLRALVAGPDDLLPVLAADAERGFGDPDERSRCRWSLLWMISWVSSIAWRSLGEAADPA
jgi:hypothetical protein